MDGRAVLEVAGVGEVQEVVRGARRAGVRLRVVGSRSVERFLQPQAECWDRVSTVGLGGIAVAGRDFTVRVGAGVLLADLDEALARLGLVWPVRRVEAPGTVGGLIASGRGTTIAAQDGPARRWVLGARLVDGTGEVLTVGGATVKNSVGYGVTHALWGCEGRLGAMVELTLRVRGRRVSDNAPGETLDRAELERAAALVRCEDLAPGTAGQALDGMAGAVRAVGSSDGLRVVGIYGERSVAEADAAALREGGIAVWVEPIKKGERGEGRGVRGIKGGMERVGVERGSRAEAGCPEDPHPNPLPRGEGDGADADLPGEALAPPGRGCPEDPHPSPLPRGEGEGADGPRPGETSATPLVGCAEDPSPQPSPPGESPLHNPGLVARKTPHRFRPKTAESFGKLRTGSASPVGEGKNGGSSKGLTSHTRPSGYAKVSGEGVRAEGAIQLDEGEGGGQVGSGAVAVVRGALDPGGVFV